MTLKKLKSLAPKNNITYRLFGKYQCKYTSEIQSVNFGASQKQIPKPKDMFYTIGNHVSDATDNLCHCPCGIWAYLSPVIKHTWTKHSGLTKLHVISDGPTTQYRNKSNIYLFSTKRFDFGFHERGIGTLPRLDMKKGHLTAWRSFKKNSRFIS